MTREPHANPINLRCADCGFKWTNIIWLPLDAGRFARALKQLCECPSCGAAGGIEDARRVAPAGVRRPMSRLSNIRLVRQEDPNGCLVACMAMIAGLSYQDVRALFPRVAKDGLTHYSFMDFLARHDFAYQFLFKFDQTNYAVRDGWPRAPWADAHICGVDAGRGGESSHGVVLLRDGTILDPIAGALRRMSDYPKCGYMCGIFDVRP